MRCVDNPQLFLNPELSDEDREILESIFLCKEKLINEIKVRERACLFYQIYNNLK